MVLLPISWEKGLWESRPFDFTQGREPVERVQGFKCLYQQ